MSNMPYTATISILMVFIFITILLVCLNPKGFNTVFGYEIFITAPVLLLTVFLVKEIMTFIYSPSSSIFNNFSFSNSKLFVPAISTITLLLVVGGFFLTLYVGGVFNAKPPENNLAVLINFCVFISVASICIFLYRGGGWGTNINNPSIMPYEIRKMFNERTKYLLYFIALIIFITALYLVNPYGVMTKYGGPVVFFTMFVGIILILMIVLYQYFLTNPSKIFNNQLTFNTFFFKSLYIILSLVISFALIFYLLKLIGLFDQNAAHANSWPHILLNLFLFCAMLGVIYKLANAGGFLDRNPLYRLIINCILYIPCLFVELYNETTSVLFGIKTGNKPKPGEIKILLVSLALIVGYFVVSFGSRYVQKAYLKQGGKSLVNQPIPTNNITNVSTYQNLIGENKKNYQYAMSMWIFLDSFAPSTYDKYVSLFSFGDNPAIKYNPTKNTLIVTVKPDGDVKQPASGQLDKPAPGQLDSVINNVSNAIEYVKTMALPLDTEYDDDKQRIVYKNTDILLQKWNHIVLNNNGGTLDIFYNGMLVKSAIEVVPYIKFNMLTIGSNNGVSGNVANLMYFKTPLDILKINTLYVSLKNNNPPVIPENK